jgi:uncharacterized protein (TIGR02145 family)
VSDQNSAATSYCFRYECADCSHNPYLTGNDEAAASGCYWYPECEYGGVNTYTVSMYDAGIITVWAKAKTQDGCVDSVATAIGSTPIITWLSGSENQTVVDGNAITSIVYTTTNATDAIVTGLPPGVSGAWVSNTCTISGTPASDSYGTFTYTVTATNNNGCANVSTNGTLIVFPAGCIHATLTLGAVGFTSTATYNVNGLIISSPVTVTYCNNRAVSEFESSYGSGVFKADCAPNTYSVTSGNWFSWCMVNQYEHVLCPTPWRVPSKDDFCQLMNGSATNCNNNAQTLNGKYGFELTGMIWTGSGIDATDQAGYYLGSKGLPSKLVLLIYNAKTTSLSTGSAGSFGSSLRCVK